MTCFLASAKRLKEPSKTTRLNCPNPRAQFNYLPKNSRVLSFMAEFTQPTRERESSELHNKAALENKKRCPANLSQVKLGCINLVVVSTGAQLCESPLMQGSVGLRRKSILTDISFLYSGRILANTDGNSSQWLKMFSGTCIKFRQNSSQVSLQGYKTPKQVVVIHTLKYDNQLTLVSRSC